MWIVRLALRRPYTFVVMSFLIVLLGIVTIVRMPTDIFPEIDIPVISVVWNYGGLSPDEMDKRIVSNYERALTTTVNDIEHIESQALYGVSVIKVYFQPGAKIEAATAQVTAISQTMLRQLPPGATPPLIIRYSASNAPILQASLGSDSLSEQQLFDIGANFLRAGLAVVQGAQVPFPYGGKQRLYWLGHTLNVMTLGGMALAVGILVDDATVEIENIHRNIALNGQKKPLVAAILDGAQQIAVPAFVSTLCICIVFVPVTFITGAARSLFVPMAMAVVFAMLTSYMLSRTLVPTMVQYLLAKELHLYTDDAAHGAGGGANYGVIWRVHTAFNARFEVLRRGYGACLAWVLAHRRGAGLAFSGFVLASLCLLPLVGRDFFPSVDAGQIRLHVRCAPGTRVEETERKFGEIEEVIRKVIPAEELSTVLDNIGIPVSGINLALGDPSMISAADGEILIALHEEHHESTPNYVRKLRRQLNEMFPEVEFFFLAPDISTQVLNFGLSAPIDIQLTGPRANVEENQKIARTIRDRVARIPGAVDVHIHQVVGTPELRVNVDRTLAEQAGLSQRNVAGDLLISLSSSGQTAPNYWLDNTRGVQYAVAVQTPQYKLDTLQAIEGTPIAASERNEPELLGNLATVSRSVGPTNITHFNVAPTIDVLAGIDGTDLGSVSAKVDAVIESVKPTLPRGTSIVVHGQVESMNSSFRGLAFGLILAVVLVYLLMVVNFQSLLDPLIILMALPGALSGIVWMLFVTGTTVSVPSLMGAIMSIGVATANSILVITFANDLRKEGYNAHDAALMAGITRLRPVIMTALAMIIGMLPMSIGLGEGGEQNAPLGRAVIGGLILATFSTLFFVPLVYSALRSKAPAPSSAQANEYLHAA